MGGDGVLWDVEKKVKRRREIIFNVFSLKIFIISLPSGHKITIFIKKLQKNYIKSIYNY